MRLELGDDFGFRLSFGTHERRGSAHAFARRPSSTIDLQNRGDRDNSILACPAYADSRPMRQNSLI